MDIESTYRRDLKLTGDPSAAASLVLAEAMLGHAPKPEPHLQPQARITVAEASKMFNIPKRTIQSACRTGRLNHVRTGRIIRLKPADLELFLSGVEMQSGWRLGS
ncbi:helix-turn-helix domain-containing protein [Lacipirellula parvula]|uniref:Helix-turn-helix domain-containing protein n=1 Tax=Lacipirellula parvula TaxID=2650471 RepID=A0A5K7XDL2_9BACT|nr:helix-turn-helix domain-containing protein [Lacipirellula parvula]BBO34568.1 hypothetical protein PLANPX_4180 [Lacipirellula parvula]